MGNSDSIDFSLSNLYSSWYVFRRGKRNSSEILAFQYSLESNIVQLHRELMTKTYRHGSYANFTVEDSKKREIAVAPVRDRLVHRLVYDYLMRIWDKHFIYDAWSCRPGKGQHKAIARASSKMNQYSKGWLWRADIIKFFDSVDQRALIAFIEGRTFCPDTRWLVREILASYHKGFPETGMPIGNLTSQIFANIYLNEFDRYMSHSMKPAAYLRYGDDWICFDSNPDNLRLIRQRSCQFLSEKLKLAANPKLDSIQPAYRGATYLGVDLWPNGKRITRKTRDRIQRQVNYQNIASYQALYYSFSNDNNVKRFHWNTLDYC